jgi:hypothetical protein
MQGSDGFDVPATPVRLGVHRRAGVDDGRCDDTRRRRRHEMTRRRQHRIENTSGRSPDYVAREIFQKSEHGVQIYFVAFDTSADRFSFLKDVQGDVNGAHSGPELRKALDEIYQSRILAEASTLREREPESR